MKRFAIAALIVLFLGPPAFAVPMLVNYTFSGNIEQNETSTQFDLSDNFYGSVSYVYDEAVINRSIELGRTFLYSHEINLSYEIHVGDWLIYNFYDDDHPSWSSSYATFDVLCWWSDEIPNQAGIDGLTGLDMITLNPYDLSIRFTGLSGEDNAYISQSVYGTITDLNIYLTPVPEPATILLITVGIIGIIGKRKFSKIG